jgi:hypothetical protein
VEGERIRTNLQVKSFMERKTCMVRLRNFLNLLGRKSIPISAVVRRLENSAAGGFKLISPFHVVQNLFDVQEVIEKIPLAKFAKVGGLQREGLDSQVLQSMKPLLQTQLLSARDTDAPGRLQFQLPAPTAAKYCLFTNEGRKVLDNAARGEGARYSEVAEVDKLLVVHAVSAVVPVSRNNKNLLVPTKDQRRVLSFKSPLEIVLPKGSRLAIVNTSLFPSQTTRKKKGTKTSLDVHVTFEVVGGEQLSVKRRELRQQLETKPGLTVSAPAMSGEVTTFRALVCSDDVQEQLQNCKQNTEKMRQLKARLKRHFEASLENDRLKSIPTDLKFGRSQRTLKDMGLDGWDGVEYYDLNQPVSKLRREGHMYPGFGDLGIRSIGDFYSPGEARVYVIGRGKIAEWIGMHGRRIDKLCSQRDCKRNESNPAEKARLGELIRREHAELRKKRQRFYRSAAHFLAETFDFVALADLSTNALLTQPQISSFVKRRMGVLAIEEFRRLVCAACNGLTEQVKIVPKQDEACSTKALQCCHLCTPNCGAAKTVLCPFGCKVGQGQGHSTRTSQERDGGASRTLAAKCYMEPSVQALQRLCSHLRDKSCQVLEALEALHDVRLQDLAEVDHNKVKSVKKQLSSELRARYRKLLLEKLP